jgi:Kelch motif
MTNVDNDDVARRGSDATLATIDLPRDSLDDTPRSSPDDLSSTTMSRSSSKSSSLESSALRHSKPPKPRRPTYIAERTSSIKASQPKNLKLNKAALKNNVVTASQPSPMITSSPTKRASAPVDAKTPVISTLTPVIDRSQERAAQSERRESYCTCGQRKDQVFSFPLSMPTRPDKDRSKVPATQLYWHQPSMHGMLPNAPPRRSHSIAQIGSSIYLYGGSDGKPPRATNTMFIFDLSSVFCEFG